MSSDPRAASSSSAAAKPSSSSSGAKPSSSSSSSAKPPSGPSGSSPSAAKPSSSSSSASKERPASSSSSSAKPASGSSSSSSSTPPAKPAVAIPTISANAWMSFFLFVCLVLIILQGPLGLTGSLPGGGGYLGNFGGLGGFGGSGGGGCLPGCGGYVAGMVPWCQPQQQMMVPGMPYMQQPMQQQVPQVMMQPQPVYAQPRPQMGGQGVISSPQGGGGYSWYAEPQPQAYRHYRPAAPAPVNVQYQRPGLQIQVSNGGMLCQYLPYACQPLIPVAYAAPLIGIASPPLHAPQQIQQGPPVPLMPIPPIAAAVPPQGLQNLESAFYPLLVGAIALLVIFDYASG